MLNFLLFLNIISDKVNNNSIKIYFEGYKNMVIVYYDVGGAHSSATAANIHINKLPMDRTATKDELLSLPTFDKIQKKDIAHLMFIGEDEYKNKVYTIGCRRKMKFVLNPLSDMYRELTGNTEGLLMVSTQPTVNLLMKIGGFSSRALNLVSFGRPIVTSGTQKTYSHIVDIVKETKKRIKISS